jgi:Zn-dependent protease
LNYDLLTGVKWYLVFLFSTTFHEAAHAWSALKLGDDTAHRGGQVTLDPTPHIRRAPFGMVIVPIVSYLMGGWMIGWASAPYDPRWAIANPKRSALMSLAGPAANLILVIIAAILIRAGIAFHFFESPESISFTNVVDATASSGMFFPTILSITFSLNLLLCAFNLLPLPPLDGSGALLIFTNSETAEKILTAFSHPQLRFFGLFLAWKGFDYVFPSIHNFAINLLYLGVEHYSL